MTWLLAGSVLAATAGCARDMLDRSYDTALAYQARWGITRFQLPESGEPIALPDHILPEDFRGSRSLTMFDLDRIGGRKMAADFKAWLEDRCPSGDRTCLRAMLEAFDFACAEGPSLMRCALHRHHSAWGDTFLKSRGQRFLWIVTVDGPPHASIAVTAEPTRRPR